MRLAFDVGAEWAHLSAQMSWRRMARYRLGMGLLRWWDSLWISAGRTLQSIHPIRTMRLLMRRVRWMMPRVSMRVTGGVGGTVLLCAFIGLGIRMWGTESGAAKAGVVRQVGEVLETKVASGPGPEGPAWREASPPAPRVDEGIRRRVALARAREQCMERLAQTDDYAKAKAEFDRLDEKVRALRSDDPFRELPRTSVDWIQAKSELKRVVDEAMKADPEVEEAEEAVKALGARKR
jgi:hypothetical protein